MTIDITKYDWRFAGNIKNIEQIKTFESKKWYYKRKYVGKEFTKYEYYCAVCAGLCVNVKIKALITHNMNVTDAENDIVIYKNGEHCEVCNAQNCTKNRSLVELVNLIYKTNLKKPFQIKLALEEQNVSLSTKRISHILYNSKKNNTKVLTISEISNHCSNIEKDHQNIKIIKELGANKSRILLLDQRLYKNVENITNVHLDCTYRLNDMNFPVYILGFTDNNKKFYLLAIAIVSDESEMTYEWCFEQVTKIAGEKKFSPATLISDAAPQIHNFFEKSSILTKHVICWAHVFRNIQKTLGALSKTEKESFLKDVHVIQRSYNSLIFNIGCQLLMKKYENFVKYDVILKTIKKNYFDKNNTWYEGYSMFNPSTNNALESFNRVLKDKYCNWNKKNLRSLIDTFIITLEDLSDDYTKRPPILQTMVYDNPRYFQFDNFCYDFLYEKDDLKAYIVITHTSKLNTEINFEDIKEKVRSNNYENFKTFDFVINNFPVLYIKKPGKHFSDFFCSCTLFLKEKKCNHVMKFLMDEKLESIVEIGLFSGQKKRGRPKKIVKGGALSLK